MDSRAKHADPDLMVYEDPSSLDLVDWERFCKQMRAEAQRFPESENVRATLRAAERMCSALRKDAAETASQAA